MTKADLIKALEGVPDNAPILFDKGWDYMGQNIYDNITVSKATVVQNGMWPVDPDEGEFIEDPDGEDQDSFETIIISGRK